MDDNQNNIKLNYMYRDAGNYKLHGETIFSNPENLPVDKIENEIRSKLIDGEFFDPMKWKLKPLSFEKWDDDLDHFWNEFEAIQSTSEKPTSNKTISSFLNEIA